MLWRYLKKYSDNVMESLMFMATGTLAITKIIQKYLDSSTTWTAASSTGEKPQNITSHNSEQIFQTRSYFNVDTHHVSSSDIDIHELETSSCKNTHECTERYGAGFSCTLIERPLELSISIDGIEKRLVYSADCNSNVPSSNQGLNCSRCVPTGESRHVLKCSELTSVAVGSVTYTPQTKRFNAHWKCENLYPDMFSEDPTTGDVTICHACGAAENRGRLIHKESRLSWDEHYKLYGRYDPAVSLVCECYPFPFEPEDVAANTALYADGMLSLPPTSTCMRSNCAPGRPHLTNPRSCECPRGYVSCPVFALRKNEEFHRQLCWGSYVHNIRGRVMPSCVRDPCKPHATLDVRTGQCVADSYDAFVLNDNKLFPKTTWGVPVRRQYTWICGTDLSAPIAKKKNLKL